jgi:vitamin B12 transporter
MFKKIAESLKKIYSKVSNFLTFSRKCKIAIGAALISLAADFQIKTIYSQRKYEYLEITLPTIEHISTLSEKQVSKTPFDVKVITKDQIQTYGITTVAEAINSIGGALARSYGNKGSASSPSLRASTASHTIVLVDGKRVNVPSLGQADLNSIPINIGSIERIEVLQGVSSALYGSEAIGGVINIITKKITKNSVYFSSYLGSFSTFHNEIYATVREKKLGAALGLSYENSEGFRTNSEYEIKSVDTKFQYFLSEESILTFNFNSFVKNAGSPGSISFPSPTANLATLNTLFGVGFEAGLLKSNLYFHSFTTNYIDSFSNTTAKNFVYTFDITKTFRLSENNALTSGLEISQEKLNSVDLNTPANSIGRKTRGKVAGFLQADLKVGKSVFFLAGTRYDNIGGKDHLSPRASLGFEIAKYWLLGVNYGHGFRAPTFNDLFWPDTPFAVGNPNLKPEVSDEYEALVKFARESYTAKFNVFKRNVRDLIIWVPDASFKYSPQNIAKTATTGVGFENQYSFKKVSIGLSINFFDPKDKTNKTKIRFAPKYQLKPYITFYPTDTTIVSCEYYLNQQYVVVAGDPSTYDNLDCKLTQQVKLKKLNGEIFLMGKNILNRHFQYLKGYPVPGPAFYLGVSFQY